MFIIFSIHQIKLRTCVQGEGGGQDHCVRIAYAGGGGLKLAKFCVRTLWIHYGKIFCFAIETIFYQFFSSVNKLGSKYRLFH